MHRVVALPVYKVVTNRAQSSGANCVQSSAPPESSWAAQPAMNSTDAAALWERLWGRTMPRDARLQPLRAASCADPDRCVGVPLEGGACICYAK